MKKYYLPTRIIDYKDVYNSNYLLIKKSNQITTTEESLTEFKGGSFIVFDFGKEMNGGIRILTYLNPNNHPGRIRIRFGESLSECYSEIGEKNSTNDHSLRDFVVELPILSDLIFGETGFRFVRIDCLSSDIMWIKNIYATSYELNKKIIYKYNGNDELINNIFNIAKRTIDLCAGNGYVVDGIKRDRLIWIGDMHPEMLALTTLYGKTKEVERSLDLMRKQTPLPRFMNNFPTYSMWWIIIIADYYKLTNNFKFVSKQLNYLEKLIDLLNSYVDDNGNMSYPFYFVDWPTKDTKDEITGSRFINMIAARKAKELLVSFNRPYDKADYLYEKLKRGNLKVENKKQVIALKYFALGNISDQEYEMIIKDGSNGFSTFMAYYILETIASRNVELSIKLLKEYYGSMIDKGATTFFEDYDIKWADGSTRIDEIDKSKKDIHGDYGKYCYKGFRHSLCHGWSSGIIKFIKDRAK